MRIDKVKELGIRGFCHGIELLFTFAGLAIFGDALNKGMRTELIAILAVYLWLGFTKLMNEFEGYDLASKYAEGLE